EDAIRQHLELKRQHGASEEELSRQAAEALGPVRREEAGSEEAAVPAEGQAEHTDAEVAPSVVDEGALHVEVAPGEPAPPPEEAAEAPPEHATEAHPEHVAEPHPDHAAEALPADDPAAVEHRDDLVPSGEPEPH